MAATRLYSHWFFAQQSFWQFGFTFGKRKRRGGWCSHWQLCCGVPKRWDRLGSAWPNHCEGSGDEFGLSVSLSLDGKTILIGGPSNDSNGFSSGHALVFRQSPKQEEWRQLGQELVGEAADDLFGFSTSISDSGTRISIGAVFNDGNGDRAGHVRVYDLQ